MNYFLRKSISFYIKKIANLCNELSLLLTKKSADIYPYTSINNLDKQIANIIPSLLNSKTFYIEVGANDGITQSNTYFLEKIYGAKGMLIEASPTLFEKCYMYRSKDNIFEHCALVSSNYNQTFIELIYGNLWTTVKENNDIIPNIHAPNGLIKNIFKKILKLSSEPSYNFLSPAISLDKLIEKHSIESVDLLSLDVEGNELNVLEGCNLNQRQIHNILVESRNHEKITEYLSKYGYSLVSKLSYHDYLYTKKKYLSHKSN